MTKCVKYGEGRIDVSPNLHVIDWIQPDSGEY